MIYPPTFKQNRIFDIVSNPAGPVKPDNRAVRAAAAILSRKKLNGNLTHSHPFNCRHVCGPYAALSA